MTPLAATEAERIERERIAFEEAASRINECCDLGFKRLEHGPYADTATDCAWLVWLAARALQQTAEPASMAIARERAGQLGRAGMEFAANLCRLGTVTIKGVDYVRRDTVMNEAIEWREKFNKAPDIPRPAAPARAPSTDSAAVDYKLLLAKYIEHVGAEEGTDFINSLYRNSSGGWEGMSNKVVFSQLEKEALEDASLPQTKEEPRTHERRRFERE